ncbi:MAG: zinc ABC transporter substrate-binding protein [Bacteroidales bacterium]|nr:zinc ABC transporter substrate-binding protein [Bacteroidales bacterium]
MLTRVMVTAGVLTILLGCSHSDSDSDSGPIPVVATTGMIADAVRNIGGDYVQVETLMGPGVDPHRYTPTPGDLSRLATARLVVYNGLHLEGKMADVLAHGSTRTLAITSQLQPTTDLRSAEADGLTHDPHVWFDVALWSRCVETIRDTLATLDPAHAEDYRTNCARYQRQLAELDAEVRQKVDSIPKPRRILVTSHDAFGYFGRAYGLEVHGLQGVSTAAETPLSEVQELARFLGTRQIPAVFGETSVPPKGLQKVLDTVKAEYNREVQLIGGDQALYSDALGPAGSAGGTYIGMVRHNITIIADALNRP